jgi:hypothetical protein
MLYSGDRELDDKIVELLAEGRLTIKSICAQVSPEHPVTLRAVYKVVNKLTSAGVVLKVGKRVMLNQEWTAGVAGKLGVPSVPLIAPGERIVHIFTSLDNLDTFWKSMVLPLEKTIHAKEIFFYNPHDFWALLPSRRASEDAYYTHFGSEQQGFFTIGGESAADLAFKRQYQTDYLQINLGNISSIKRTDHVTVLGSYVILTRLSKSVSDQIDALYSSGKSSEELMPALLSICAKPGKLRLSIENNPKKAEKLRKVLARDFYFRKEA